MTKKTVKRKGITAHILPSGSARVQVYVGKDENGKRIYKSFTDPDPIMAIQAALDYKQHKGEPTKPKSITIGKAVEQYIDSKENILSPSTIEGYRNVQRNRLQPIKDMDIDKFDTSDAQAYINGLSKNISPKSVSNAWGLVVSAIQLQVPDKVLRVTLPAKKKVVRELPTAQEVINAIKGTDVELPALLAMWLSLRMSEVRGIKYKDITRGILTVRRTILTVKGEHIAREQTKTYGSTRRIKLPEHIQKLIGSGDPNDFIIKQTAEVIYKHFVHAIECAGLPHIRFHDLRHLNASIMLQLGIPEKYAMERGGWTTNSTLQNVYQHTFSAERAAVDEKVDAYFNQLLG